MVTMITDPHLFFAEISLDLSRGEHFAGLKKLEAESSRFADSYTYNLLLARAYRGLQRYQEGLQALKACCRIAPHNQVAWKELVEVHFLQIHSPVDMLTSELEALSEALAGFAVPKNYETADPTPLVEQKQPFSDEEAISVPTESLASLFTAQGAYKKAIRVYTDLMQIHPDRAEAYKKEISGLLDKL